MVQSFHQLKSFLSFDLAQFPSNTQNEPQLKVKNPGALLTICYLDINFTRSNAKFWQFFFVEQNTRQE